jgi:hypothetical protein
VRIVFTVFVFVFVRVFLLAVFAFNGTQQFLGQTLAELDVSQMGIVAFNLNGIGELVVEGQADGEQKIGVAQKDGVLGVVLVVVRSLGSTQANDGDMIAADVADEIVQGGDGDNDARRAAAIVPNRRRARAARQPARQGHRRHDETHPRDASLRHHLSPSSGNTL